MQIRDVAVATVRADLPEPIRFGDWVMRHREFALARVRDADGQQGFAFTLTREGPVAAAIRQAVAPIYAGAAVRGVHDAADLFERCRRSNLACLNAGIGLRGLSIVDLALYDLLGRQRGMPVAGLLGGGPRPMPATAIVGYPPSLAPEAVARQVDELVAAGWRRFKIPVCLPLDRAGERLLAARRAAGRDSWLGMDGAWVFSDVAGAEEFLRSVEEAQLDWFEDVFPPGDSEPVAALRSVAGRVQIAMGDEQGGAYYPDALVRPVSVDAIRIDLTCMGGISGGARILKACGLAGVPFAPHMFAHVHSQVFAGWGITVPIEWGIPGTGVDQYADSLAQPTIERGWMQPLDPAAGFGTLVNAAWLTEQEVDDPSGIVRELSTDPVSPRGGGSPAA